MPKRPRNYAAEYQRRKSLNLSRGFSVAQARGHARKTERSVSEVKKAAKESNTPIEKIQKLKIGNFIKGATNDTDWRQIEYNGFDFYTIRHQVESFPSRTRLWLIIQMTTERYMTIYHGRSETKKSEKHYFTLISNRTKFDFLEIYTEQLENEWAPFTIKSILRFKPL